MILPFHQNFSHSLCVTISLWPRLIIIWPRSDYHNSQLKVVWHVTDVRPGPGAHVTCGHVSARVTPAPVWTHELREKTMTSAGASELGYKHNLLYFPSSTHSTLHSIFRSNLQMYKCIRTQERQQIKKVDQRNVITFSNHTFCRYRGVTVNDYLKVFFNFP